MKAGTTIVTLLLFFCNYPALRAQTISGVINSYYKITAVNTAINSVTVDNSAGLTPGERVLVIQSKGANISSANAAGYGDITAINNAGKYEFNTICTVAGNEVVLKSQLVNSYDPAGYVQLVSVPSFSSVTVAGTVNGNGWDPVAGKGGIVVIEATGTIFLNADINVSGQGFQGGALVNYATPTYDCDWATTVNNYFLPFPASGDFTGGKKGEGISDYIINQEYGMGKLASGGGGGNNANTGGAGGGNYGKGGDGGKRSGETFFLCHGAYPGVGGLSLAPYGFSPAVNRIFFGGGGGSGHENNGVGLPGGNGGGIIILSAAVIAGGGGSLFADGVSPINPTNLDPTQADGDGGGGGGAGGTVILNAASVTGAVIATANGARGSDASNEVSDCTGPGGGGGGGVIWAAGGTFPAAVSASVNGGANGVVSAGNTKPACRGSANGAMPGDPGASQSTYAPPVAGVNLCVPLASSMLKYFTADLGDRDRSGDLPDVLLSWELYAPADAAGIVNFTIERSDDHIHFRPLATIAAVQDAAAYHFTDAAPIEGTVLYRLVWLDETGSRSYSRILAVSGSPDPGFGFIRLHPNPVKDLLTVELFSRSGSPAIVKIFDARGQQLAVHPFTLHSGTTSLNLTVKQLASGTYFLVAEAMGRRQVQSFIRRE
ncbi:MAG TPA: T9SS type A sorting domain-containing protein [Puia sp.]|nr:T9SS type A sorting domain-containing protein [Puia sp.]